METQIFCIDNDSVITIKNQKSGIELKFTFAELEEALAGKEDTISIVWGIGDFASRAEEIEADLFDGKLTYDRSKFKEALIALERGHDACYGINWDTIDTMLDIYCLLPDRK